MKYFFVYLLCFIALVSAEDHVEVEETEEPTGLASINIPGDFALSEGFLRAMSMAGAIVTGVAGFAAILSFVLPLIGFRTCLLLGSCADESTQYSQGVNSNSVYDQGYTGYNYGGGFRKRSLEYVGPILKALSSAYDKYGPPAHKQARSVAAKPSEKKRR